MRHPTDSKLPGRRVRGQAARLGPLGVGHVARQNERVASWRRLLAAYDVDRQLERGYSLTLTASGRLVRSVGALAEQQEIVTRFADGTVESRWWQSVPPLGGRAAGMTRATRQEETHDRPGRIRSGAAVELHGGEP